MSREEQMMRIGFGVLTESAPQAPSFDETGDLNLQFVQREGTRRRSTIMPTIVTAVAVLIAISVPALLFREADPDPVGQSPVQPPIEQESFQLTMQEWELIAVVRMESKPDVGVYLGPPPDSDGEVAWIEGPGTITWLPGRRDGAILTLTVPDVRLYALIREEAGRVRSIVMGDPHDLLGQRLDGGGTLLERASRVDVIDGAAWEEFIKGRSASPPE